MATCPVCKSRDPRFVFWKKWTHRPDPDRLGQFITSTIWSPEKRPKQWKLRRCKNKFHGKRK